MRFYKILISLFISICVASYHPYGLAKSHHHKKNTSHSNHENPSIHHDSSTQLASNYSLATGLDHIIQNASQNAHIGVFVQSVENGNVLYQYNANHLFTPASVQKLFVAITALAYLKPDFHFLTSIYTDGKIEQGVLNGDLYVQFSGDPKLTSNDLAHLIQDLKKLGVATINGHVYIDNTAYDNIPYPPGWAWGDLTYSYAAPLNAIIINKNRFTLSISPAPLNNQSAILDTNLPDGVVFLENKTLTTSKSGQCPTSFYSDIHNDYQITGCIPRQYKTQYYALAIRNPVIYGKVLIKELLKNNQINFDGDVRFRAVPNNSQPLAVHQSPPLQEILHRMLKKSDNLITNALLKKIGQVYNDRSATWQNSISAMKSILSRSTDINFQNNLLTDGAGLSRYNLISPHQLVKLLNYAYHDEIIRNVLYATLPIAGKDGTLSGRMPSTAKEERVHAKTGTMSGVTALAGFVKTKHYGTLAFAIITNGFVGPRVGYKQVENQVCTFLVEASH